MPLWMLSATLVWLAVILIAIEGATRIGFSHISNIESRIAAEHAEALAMRQSQARPSVLLLGNSLLLDDVNMDSLRALIPKNFQLVRFPVESTYFLDWKYGMRRLFADGARPDVIVLVLGPTHIVANGIRGDYSAFYLFNTADIPAIGHEIHLSRTDIASLYTARYSLFWAGRSNLRNFVLGKTMPGYANFLHHVSSRGAQSVPSGIAERLSRERLADAAATARRYRSRFVLVMPPGFFAAAEGDVVRGAEEAKVQTLVPAHNGTWPARLFRDGFHLNADGAARFTDKLAAELGPLLQNGLHEGSTAGPGD